MISYSGPGTGLAISLTSAMASCRRLPSSMCKPWPIWCMLAAHGRRRVLRDEWGDAVFLNAHASALASKSEDALVETHILSASTAQMIGVLLMAHGSPDNL